MAKKLTLRDRVRNILLRRRKSGISSLWAFKELGITRLSAIIYDLRHKEGLNIISTPVRVKNRYGDYVYYDRYILAEDKK